MWKILFLFGNETNYEVSTKGKIRNKKTKKELTLYNRGGRGYLHTCLHVDYYDQGRRVINPSIHRLVALTFLDNDDPEHKTQVDHINGIKSDNRVYNLEWVTPAENVHRAQKNGLCHYNYGEAHHNSKYTEDEVRAVCKLLEDGKMTNKAIGELYNMTPVEVHNIRAGLLWPHISREYKIPVTKKIRNMSMYHAFIERNIIRGMTNKELMKFRPSDVTKKNWNSVIRHSRQRLLRTLERSTTIPGTLEVSFDWQ